METLIQSLKERNCVFDLSPQGLSTLLKKYDPKIPNKHVYWTTDPEVELPIVRPRVGPGSEVPLTFEANWTQLLAKFGEDPALSEKIEGSWITYNYNEYYAAASRFALGLIHHGISERSTVSVLSYNCPKWAFAFHGTVMANVISTGVYLTNSPEACLYTINHSNSEAICVEN